MLFPVVRERIAFAEPRKNAGVCPDDDKSQEAILAMPNLVIDFSLAEQ